MSEFKPKVWMKCPLCGKPSPMPDPDAREWVGLTDEEVVEIVREAARAALIRRDGTTTQRIARAIEAKLREKNR